uniref:Ig-like domain-containing protein n=1 Tax=Bursaphelenchus xylophilus TaxID=6326 RepID=A0A1I7S9W3_BURXY
MNGYPTHSFSQLTVDPAKFVYHPTPQRSPLTKQVDQLEYYIPQNKYAKNPWSYAPEFLKVFTDVRVPEGGKAVFDCVLLGSPRPRVCWLFNDEKLTMEDVIVEDTADLCRITIPYVQSYHYGTYTVLCENEPVFSKHFPTKFNPCYSRFNMAKVISTLLALCFLHHVKAQCNGTGIWSEWLSYGSCAEQTDGSFAMVRYRDCDPLPSGCIADSPYICK